jgi:hypothetical protein
MTTTTPTTALADLDLDLDELRALCDAVKRPWYGTLQIADGVTDDDAVAFIEAFSPDTVSDLIALARRAAQPAEGAAPVEQFASDLAARQVELPADFANVLANMPYEEEPAEGAGQAGQYAITQVRSVWVKPGETLATGWHDVEANSKEVEHAHQHPDAYEVRTLYTAPTERAAAPADPLDQKLPCAISIGNVELTTNDRLGTLVKIAQQLDRATQQPSAQKGGA